MEVKERIYKKREGTYGFSGQLYEIQLTILWLLEAERSKRFQEITSYHLAANVQEAGYFDDLVVAYRYRDKNDEEKSKIIFMQAKHKERKRIRFETMLSTDVRSEFGLRRYFNSFMRIRQRFSAYSEHPFLNGKVEDCDFVIFTNASIDFKDNKSNYVCEEIIEQNNFLNLTEYGKYCKILKTEEVINVLRYSLDYELLVNAMVKMIESKSLNMNHPIIRDYQSLFANTMIKRVDHNTGEISENFFELSEFKDDVFQEILKHKQFSKLTSEQFTDFLRKTRIKITQKFDIINEDQLLPSKFIDDETITMFLNQFRIFIDQPDSRQLTGIIKNKIRTIYNLPEHDADVVFSELIVKVANWWNYDNQYITENNKTFLDILRVSINFNVRSPTEIFTGRRKELANLHEIMQNDKKPIVVISGLGGIGKTELVRRYIQQYSQCYDNNIIWINSEHDINIADSFLRLAGGKLNISIRNINGEKKSIETVAEQVYQFFSKRKSLFVFDNVDNCKNLVKMLPLNALKPSDNQPYIMITSRDRDWDYSIKVIVLDMLSMEEAIELVKKGLNIGDDSDDEEIEKLVERLECFPLAIRQAIGYIENERILDKYTIADYLKEFDSDTKELLNSTISQGIFNDYFKTTYTTWNNTIKQISKEPHGHISLKLLSSIAFISNKNIDKEIFLKLPDMSEKDLTVSIKLLVKYCIISSEKKHTILHVHKLVQEQVRLDIIERNKLFEVMEQTRELLKNSTTEQFMLHIETFLYHIENICTTQTISCGDFENMMNWLCDGYLNFNRDKGKKAMERIIQFDYDPKKTFIFWIKFASFYGHIKDFQSKIKCLEEALKVDHVRDNYQTFIIFANLIVTNEVLGNFPIRELIDMFRYIDYPTNKTELTRLMLHRDNSEFFVELIPSILIELFYRILYFIKSDEKERLGALTQLEESNKSFDLFYFLDSFSIDVVQKSKEKKLMEKFLDELENYAIKVFRIDSESLGSSSMDEMERDIIDTLHRHRMSRASRRKSKFIKKNLLKDDTFIKSEDLKTLDDTENGSSSSSSMDEMERHILYTLHHRRMSITLRRRKSRFIKKNLLKDDTFIKSEDLKTLDDTEKLVVTKQT